jgi:hypothetical protein
LLEGTGFEPSIPLLQQRALIRLLDGELDFISISSMTGPAPALSISQPKACDRTTGVVLRGTESLLTHRWSGMDSNFQFRAR